MPKNSFFKGGRNSGSDYEQAPQVSSELDNLDSMPILDMFSDEESAANGFAALMQDDGQSNAPIYDAPQNNAGLPNDYYAGGAPVADNFDYNAQGAPQTNYDTNMQYAPEVNPNGDLDIADNFNNYQDAPAVDFFAPVDGTAGGDNAFDFGAADNFNIFEDAQPDGNFAPVNGTVGGDNAFDFGAADNFNIFEDAQPDGNFAPVDGTVNGDNAFDFGAANNFNTEPFGTVPDAGMQQGADMSIDTMHEPEDISFDIAVPEQEPIVQEQEPEDEPYVPKRKFTPVFPAPIPSALDELRSGIVKSASPISAIAATQVPVVITAAEAAQAEAEAKAAAQRAAEAAAQAQAEALAAAEKAALDAQLAYAEQPAFPVSQPQADDGLHYDNSDYTLPVIDDEPAHNINDTAYNIDLQNDFGIGDAQPVYEQPQGDFAFGTETAQPVYEQPQGDFAFDLGADTAQPVYEQPQDDFAFDLGADTAQPVYEQPQDDFAFDLGAETAQPVYEQPQDDFAFDLGAETAQPVYEQPQDNYAYNNAADDFATDATQGAYGEQYAPTEQPQTDSYVESLESLFESEDSYSALGNMGNAYGGADENAANQDIFNGAFGDGNQAQNDNWMSNDNSSQSVDFGANNYGDAPADEAFDGHFQGDDGNEPPRKKSNALLLIILAVVILAAVGVLLFFLFSNNEGSAPSEDTSTPTSTSQSTTPETPVESEPVAPIVDPIPRDEWYMELVNRDTALASTFTVTTANVDGVPVDARIQEALQDMIDAGNATGLELYVHSGYRTYDRQKTNYDNQVNQQIAAGKTQEEAEAAAAQITAAPGTSEHNLGLGVDIMSESHNSYDTSYKDTDEAKWLAANAATYGFILRYPEGKESITGFAFEPWHYRYVGVDQAQKIVASGLTFEEYLAQDAPTGIPVTNTPTDDDASSDSAAD